MISESTGCWRRHSLVIMPLSALIASLLLLNLFGLPVSRSTPQCKAGDAACFCRAVGGTWLATPTTIHPTCRKFINFTGQQRIVSVYFPQGLQATGKSYTPWLYLHGVHTGKWFVSDNPQWQQLRSTWPIPLGGSAQANELAVLTGSPLLGSSSSSSSGSSSSSTDGGGLVKDGSYILIVPEATGTVDDAQMWNSLFWPCFAAVPKCVDKQQDDLGFIASLLTNMQQQLLPGIPLQSKALLTGYSNGGMLAQALLCKQPGLASRLAGVSIVASTLGEEFAGVSCKGRMPVELPFLWMHGTADDTLQYARGVNEGIQMLGAEGAIKVWAAAMGCAASAVANPVTVYTNSSQKVTCKDYCRQQQQDQRQGKQLQASSKQQQQQQQQQQPVVLCSVAGAPHQVLRVMPGYPAALVRWAAPKQAGGASFTGTPRLI